MAAFENRQPVTAAKFINKSPLFIQLLGVIRRLGLKPNSEQKKEKKELQDELAKSGNRVSNPQECIDFALDYSLKLPSLWSSAGYTEKQRLQFLLFPKGMFYDKKKDECRTDEVNGVFSYIADVAQVLKQSKIRNSKKNFDVAALVVPTGIEPVSKV